VKNSNSPLLSILGFVLGCMVGAFATGLVAGVALFVLLKKGDDAKRKDLALTPVIVAARDLAPGTVVVFESVAQRPLPGALVTSSLVLPDSAKYIVGQRVTVPVRTGDPLAWSYFLSSKVKLDDDVAAAACERALSSNGEHARPAQTPAEIRQALLSGETR
jgi:Flp pilus assembly protein CpaB